MRSLAVVITNMPVAEKSMTVLARIDTGDGVVRARVLLERGRIRNSTGRSDQAVPLFRSALTAARSEGQDFLATDAAHMLAIAEPSQAAY